MYMYIWHWYMHMHIGLHDFRACCPPYIRMLLVHCWWRRCWAHCYWMGRDSSGPRPLTLDPPTVESLPTCQQKSDPSQITVYTSTSFLVMFCLGCRISERIILARRIITIGKINYITVYFYLHVADYSCCTFVAIINFAHLSIVISTVILEHGNSWVGP